MTLFRPVGLKELEFIAASGWRAFPPRLPSQPIFYSVTTHDYARRICSDWNSREADAGHCGFVTRFDVDDAFFARYPAQDAGGRACRELSVPAEELCEFNRPVIGHIDVVESIFGDGFAGEIDAASRLPAYLVGTLPA